MGISLPQLILILFIVLVLFGAGRLPRVMSDLAKGVRAFKKGLDEDDKHHHESSTTQTHHSPDVIPPLRALSQRKKLVASSRASTSTPSKPRSRVKNKSS